MGKGIKVDGWLDRKAAAEYIGLTDFWLEKHARTGQAPRCIQHGRKVWYRQDDLDAWMADQRNIAASGAGGTDALEGLWAMGQKRRVQTPEPSELSREYRDQWGEPVARGPAAKKAKWAELVKTFTAKQQRMLAEVKAAG